MFRLKEGGLPKDPEFPANLKELGYFITEDDKIRKIDEPNDGFQFYLTDVWRWNEVQREAMHKCIRLEVERRLLGLCIKKLYMLPIDTNAAPAIEKPDGPHIAIYATDPAKLRLKKRVVVLVNDQLNDFGILAYRILCGDGGINKGSVVSLVQELIRRSKQCHAAAAGEPKPMDAYARSEGGSSQDASTEAPRGPGATAASEDDGIPGVIVLNTGGRLYSFQMKENMSQQSWMARRRHSVVHPAYEVDQEYNLVEGHKSVEEHISSVFKQVIADPNIVSRGAEVYLMGLYDGADSLMDFLKKEYLSYSNQLAGMALVNPNGVCCSEIEEINLATFLARRTRTWVRDEESLDTPLSIPPNSISQPKTVLGSKSAAARKGNECTGKGKNDSPESGRVLWTETVNTGGNRLSDNSLNQPKPIVSYLTTLNNMGLGEQVVMDSSESSVSSPTNQAQEVAAVHFTSLRGEGESSGAAPHPIEGVHVQDFAEQPESEDTVTNTTPVISPPYNTPASRLTLATTTPNITTRRNTLSSAVDGSGPLHLSASFASISSSSGAAESSAFPMLSAGPNHEAAECVFPELLSHIVSFFEDISLAKPRPSNYRNPGFIVPDRVAKRFEEMAVQSDGETFHDAPQTTDAGATSAGVTADSKDKATPRMEFDDKDVNHGKTRLNEEDDELVDKASYAMRLEDFVRRNEGLVSFAPNTEGVGQGKPAGDSHPKLPCQRHSNPPAVTSTSAYLPGDEAGPQFNVGDRRMGLSGAGPARGIHHAQYPSTHESSAEDLSGQFSVSPEKTPAEAQSGDTKDEVYGKEDMVAIAGTKVPKSLVEAASLTGTPATVAEMDEEDN